MIETHTIHVNPFFVPKTVSIVISASVNSEYQKIRNIIFDIRCESTIKEIERPIIVSKIEASIPAILERVIMYFGVTIKEVVGRSREGNVMKARKIYCAIARQKTAASYAEIGSIVNRDHATVMNACKSVKRSEKKAIDGDTTFKDFQKLNNLFRNENLNRSDE